MGNKTFPLEYAGIGKGYICHAAWIVEFREPGSDSLPDSSVRLADFFRSRWQRYFSGKGYPPPVAKTRIEEALEL
jgi:hypothetical protein